MTDESQRPVPPQPPRGSEGDAHKDFDPVKKPEGELAESSDRYSPRHRAPGRPSLIRRRRNEQGESEEITWETFGSGADAEPDESEEEQEPLPPPPPPVEDASYLGPTRAEERRKRESSGSETGGQAAPVVGAAPVGVPPFVDPAPPTVPPTVQEPVGSPLQEASTPAYAEPTEFGAHLDTEVPARPRTAALQQRKKKKRARTAASGIAAVLLAVAGIAAAGVLFKNVVGPEKERVAVPLPAPEGEPLGGTTLVFGTKESGSSARGAIWMTLLSLDAESGKGSVVYIPPHTAVEVPGRGLQGVGQAYGSGGVPLLLVSAENLLGVKIDRYIELSDKDALVFFENLETMTVDVPAEVRVPAGRNQARLVFVEGPQELTPGLLVQLLYTVGIDGDDIELGSRHLAFWGELLDVYDDGAELAAAVRSAGAAFGESDASPEGIGAFLAALAELPPEDVTITALPVRPISAGDSELYATDEEELVAFVEETIGIDQDRPQEIRVQVLNGNGVPGIGQEVADRLVGEGFRVILSGNARRLNYRNTLVIAYDSSDEGVALAERARDLLGVGEVQVSTQQQGIVDLTIVVGKDFLRAR